VASCPKEVIKLDEDGHPFSAAPEKCIGCRFCELHCPDFAIEVQDEETSTR
jgi:2-oxoglutarate ferredoxin oxidoreductase subunit delta